MATPKRGYTELPGSAAPDVPYRVNLVLREIDVDVNDIEAELVATEGRLNGRISGIEGGVQVRLDESLGSVEASLTGANQRLESLETLADLSPGDLSDATAANLIAQPDTQTAAALDAKFVPNRTSAGKAALDRLGAIQREASAAASRIMWEDSEAVEEPWANLAAWSASTMTVSGGVLVSGTAGAGANRGISIPPTGSFRAKGTINHVAGGAVGTNTTVGVSKTAAGGAWVPSDRFAIGINHGGTIIGYTGTGLGGTGATTLEAVPIPSGVYHWTIDVGDGYASITLSSGLPGAKIYRHRTLRTWAVNNLAIASDDARGAAGDTVGPLAFRKSSASLKPIAYELAAPSHTRVYEAAGQSRHVTIPASYDSRRPLPLIISAHGNTQDDGHLYLTAARQALVEAITAKGWIYASHLMHGNNWGSPTAVADIVGLYKTLSARYPVGPVILLGESMGGLAVLNALTNDALPLAGVAILDGVCNLGWNYANGADGAGTTDASRIITAYGLAGDGSDYAAKTAKYDPVLADAGAFHGVPLQLMASPNDTRIPKTQHADKIYSKLAGRSDVSLITHTGLHTADGAYTPSNWIPFFDRCLTLV